MEPAAGSGIRLPFSELAPWPAGRQLRPGGFSLPQAVVSGPPTLVLFGAGSLCGEALIEQLSLGTPWLGLGRRQPPGKRAISGVCVI